MRRGLSILSCGFREFLLSIFVFFREEGEQFSPSGGDDDEKPVGVRMNA
jgi:hypothetical protein